MLEKAYAKINLSLDVVRKREDGYHDLDMIMLPLQLCDDVEVSISDVHAAYSDDSEVAMDEHNTIIKARNLMIETFDLKEHFTIRLTKRIPSQAGMAGGSSDAAAVMRAIAQLCHLDVSVEELAALGKQIGADVPFCVYSIPAQVQGIGEIVKPFELDWDPYILLVKPSQGVSTGEAFRRVDFVHGVHPSSDVIVELLKQKQFDRLPQHIGNSLEKSAFEMVDEIKVIKETMQKLGLQLSMMSGSGSTLFAISDDQTLIEQAYAHFIQNPDYFVCITKLR